MTDREKQLEVNDGPARDAWQRPEVRRMDAGDAETSVTGLNVDGGFS